MTQEEKLEMLAESLDCDVDGLKTSTSLDKIGWDSMAMLTVIAMIKTHFDKKVSGAEMRGFKTVGDIIAVMEK